MSLVDLGRLPNLRELIIPDPGYTIIDMDLDRADLWVLAWECQDEALINKLEEERRDKSKDIHTANSLTLFGSVDYEKRRFAKVFCHGKNYGATSPTLAKQCGISIKAADAAGIKWFSAHPGIPSWQGRINNQVAKTRTVANKFGFRRYFFGRAEDAYNQALAWVPASTVALTVHHACCNIMEDNWLSRYVQVLMNGHDSLTMQCKTEVVEEALPRIEEKSRIVIPYQEPLIIPVGFSLSNESWGKVVEYDKWKSAKAA